MIDQNTMLPFYLELVGKHFPHKIIYYHLSLVFSLFPTSSNSYKIKLDIFKDEHKVDITSHNNILSDAVTEYINEK